MGIPNTLLYDGGNWRREAVEFRARHRAYGLPPAELPPPEYDDRIDEHEAERARMYADNRIDPSWHVLIRNSSIEWAREVCARQVELKRLIAAGLPAGLPAAQAGRLLPRAFDLAARNVPWGQPMPAVARTAARASSRPTPTPKPQQPARPAAKKAVAMSTDIDFTKLDRLERQLIAIIKSSGGTVPQYNPSAPEPDAADAADASMTPERAAWRAQMDRAMGLESFGPQARREGARLSCSVFAERTPATTERTTVAPQQRVSRPAAQHTPDAAAEAHAAELRAMDIAMGTEPHERGVRMETPTRQVFRP